MHLCTVKPRYNTVVRVHEFKIALYPGALYQCVTLFAARWN